MYKTLPNYQKTFINKFTSYFIQVIWPLKSFLISDRGLFSHQAVSVQNLDSLDYFH